MDKNVKLLCEYINAAESIIFFGGAGVSTESGVPDFRSKDGLYNVRDVRFEGYSPEYLLSHTCLVKEPAVFFEFYRQKMDARSAKPNAAHLFLARLEKAGRLKAVITQNIDGLHTKAGSKTVYEIHGSTAVNYCMRCGRRYPADYIFNSSETIPRCECGGTVRCDVTLYEEQLPAHAVEGAINAIENADMLIIGGTSLTVYPAASYIRYFRGRYLALINKDKVGHAISAQNFVEINRPIGEVFSEAARITGI